MILLKSIWAGCKFLCSRGAYKWMRETKEDNDFTWPSVIGLVFFNDYRNHKHWERNSNDW